MAHYLTAAGFIVTADSVSTWLTAFMVTFYEVAGAFALVVARATGQQSPLQQVSPPPGAADRRDDDTNDHHDGDVTPPPPKGKPGRRPTVLAPEAIERLRQAGGKANGTVRGIGRLLGTRSKTASHRLLHQLADAGLVMLTATSAGMQVALA